MSNKIDRIEFANPAAGKPREFAFRYDAMGQRVAKIVKINPQAPDTWTYYVRDPQGNVMALKSSKPILA